MRVLMISKALVVGAYHTKLDELARLGIDLHVIIPTHWGRQIPEIRMANGYTIHQLPTYFSGKNHFHFYSGIKNVLDAASPDIVHIDEEPYSLVTYQVMRQTVQREIPSVFFTWQNIEKQFPFPFSSIERYSFRHAAAAIAGNEEGARVLGKKQFERDVFVIPQFGVDTEIYSKRDSTALREKLFGPDSVHVVGYVGRFVEEKGIRLLLEAFAGLPDDHRLLLVGDGPEEPSIRRAMAQLKITERIVIEKNIPSMEIPEYLSCLDCLVLPSLTRSNWKEQFGRVLIEAMACEVPVVGSDSGEIPNVIGDAGIVVPEGDVSKLSTAIRTIMQDSGFGRELGMCGRERVNNHFTQTIVASRTLDVYDKILGHRA